MLHIVLGYLLGLSLQELGLSQRAIVVICLGYLSELFQLFLAYSSSSSAQASQVSSRKNLTLYFFLISSNLSGDIAENILS